MKIREVCQKTGLTERTVRYYIERGLIYPISTPSVVSSRTEYQFDSSHVLQLRDIAILRGYGFPIDRILEMKRDPSSIGAQIEAQATETEEQEASICQRKEVFSRIRQLPIADISQLAENLRREERAFSLPDVEVETDFRRLDELEGNETGNGSSGTLEQVLHREAQKRKCFWVGIIILLLIVLGIGLLVYRERRSVTTFLTVSSATFSEKWQEEGEYFAALHFGEGSIFAGIPCTVRFENFPLYWAVVPGHEYMGATLSAEVPLREGRKEGIIIEGAIPSVDIRRILQDEILSRKYVVITTIQGE